MLLHETVLNDSPSPASTAVVVKSNQDHDAKAARDERSGKFSGDGRNDRDDKHSA